jgi:hypothetical protein
MKRYNRKQDLINRAKLAAIIIPFALLAMWLMSCSDDKDESLAGKWTFANGSTSIEFTLTEGSGFYQVSGVRINSESGTGSVTDATKNRIGSISVTNGSADASKSKGAIFFGCKLSSGNMLTDSIYFAQVTDGKIVYSKFHNEVLKKN